VQVHIPAKSTPARTRISLAVTVDPALSAAVGEVQPAQSGETPEATRARQMVEQQQQANAKALAESGERIEAALRAGFLEHRVGLPSPEDSADLRFVGRLAPGPYGAALEWQLVEPKSGSAVAAGVAQQYNYAYNLEYVRDQVIAGILAIDVDRYASGAAPVAAAEPSPDLVPDAKSRGEAAWAVVAGVERYREALPAATNAEADARAFAQYAQHTLGVPEAHVKLLLGDRAGLADLRSALEEWLPRNATRAGGRVYVFFSGHGAPDPETGEAYLVPYDADPAYLKTRGLRVSALYDALKGLPGQQSLVFLDACFSGGGERSVLAAGARPLVPVKAATTPGGVAALAAAGPRETTGAARDGVAHGLFTWYVLKGLRGEADADHDRDVTLDELARFVEAGVAADARLDNREQTPSLSLPAGLDPKAFRVVEGLP
jgi:hypothetical protein